MRSYHIQGHAVRCAALVWVLCIAAASYASSPARVFLSNGDQISGDVLNQTDDVIILRTEAAGTLEIQRRAVKQECHIPTFDLSMLELLTEGRE